LGRKDFNKFAEANNGRPAGSNMAAKAESFVLGEDENAAEIGVDAVGESDVNDAVSGAERNGGLGAIAGEGPQALALTTGEKNDDGIAHVGHGTSSGRAAERRGHSSRGKAGSKEKRGAGSAGEEAELGKARGSCNAGNRVAKKLMEGEEAGKIADFEKDCLTGEAELNRNHGITTAGASKSAKSGSKPGAKQ